MNAIPEHDDAPLRKSLKSVHKDHLWCRDLGHHWEWMTDFTPRRSAGSRQATSVTRVVICLRCGTMRHDEYSLPSFAVLKSTYRIACDYPVADVDGSVPVAQVRAEILRRFKANTWKDVDRGGSLT